MADIPPNAPDLVPASDKARQEELEFDLLETGQALRLLQKRDAGQRYWLRWIAVGTGVTVILGMAGLMAHLFHQTFWGPFHMSSAAFAVAMLVAPLASITAITVALFVGAFRKFEEKDLEAMGNGAAGAFNLFRGN